MTFSMVAAGTLAQVRAQLAASTFYGDTSQADQVRDFLLSEVDQTPQVITGGREAGLWIEANGHHDGNCRYLQINVRQIWLPVPDAATEADAEE